MSQPINSGPQHDDDRDDLSTQAPAIDEGDDTEGHLMIRTDDTVSQVRKEHGSPRRS